MTVSPQPAHVPLRTWRWLAVALVIGAAAGTVLALSRGSHGTATPVPPASRANMTWPAGARPAPEFGLVDQHGAPVSLRRFHGRPVIVTFIDPACTTLCPLEAKVLDQVAASVRGPERPAIVAVSVNPWGQTPATLRRDARKWRLVSAWYWALGRYSQLAPVWKRYDVGVLVRKRAFAGHTIRNVSHTEASVLVDAAGDERGLFVYPFRAVDLIKALHRLRAT